MIIASGLQIDEIVDAINEGKLHLLKPAFMEILFYD